MVLHVVPLVSKTACFGFWRHIDCPRLGHHAMVQIRRWGPFLFSSELPRLLSTESEGPQGVEQRRQKAGWSCPVCRSPYLMLAGAGERPGGDVSQLCFPLPHTLLAWPSEVLWRRCPGGPPEPRGSTRRSSCAVLWEDMLVSQAHSLKELLGELGSWAGGLSLAASSSPGGCVPWVLTGCCILLSSAGPFPWEE